MPLQRKACPACSLPAAAPLFRKNGCGVIRCTGCGLMYLDIYRTAREMEEIYGAALFASEGLSPYYLEDSVTTRANSAAHVRLLERHVEGGILADVGCGFGYFLKSLGPHWSATGIEISRFAAEQARARFGLRVINADFLEAELAPGSFDAVTMWDYIEHAASPMESLRKAHAVLKRGGMLFLSTPDAGSLVARLMGRHWYHFDPLQHLCYFTHETLSRALAMAGFEEKAAEHSGRRFNLDYLAYRFAYSYPGGAGKALHALSRFALSPLRMLTPHLRLNMGDIITVCAAKKAVTA